MNNEINPSKTIIENSNQTRNSKLRENKEKSMDINKTMEQESIPDNKRTEQIYYSCDGDENGKTTELNLIFDLLEWEDIYIDKMNNVYYRIEHREITTYTKVNSLNFIEWIVHSFYSKYNFLPDMSKAKELIMYLSYIGKDYRRLI